MINQNKWKNPLFFSLFTFKTSRWHYMFSQIHHAHS